MTETRDRGNVLRRSGKDDEIGGMTNLQRISAIRGERRGVLPHMIRTDNVFELFLDRGRQHVEQRASSDETD